MEITITRSFAELVNPGGSFGRRLEFLVGDEKVVADLDSNAALRLRDARHRAERDGRNHGPAVRFQIRLERDHNRLVGRVERVMVLDWHAIWSTPTDAGPPEAS